MYDEQPGEAGQLHYLLDQIEVRRAELDQLRRDIDETMAELDRVEARCRDDLRRLRHERTDRRATPDPAQTRPDAVPCPRGRS